MLPPPAALIAMASGMVLLCTANGAGAESALAMLGQLLDALWPSYASSAAQHAVPLGGTPEESGERAAAAADAPDAPQTLSAAALAAALERHCPEVSLSDLHTWALALYAAATNRLHWLGDEDETPEGLALAKRVALHSRLLRQCGSANDVSCRYAILAWSANYSRRRTGFPPLHQVYEEGIAWATQQKRE